MTIDRNSWYHHLFAVFYRFRKVDRKCNEHRNGVIRDGNTENSFALQVCVSVSCFHCRKASASHKSSKSCVTGNSPGRTFCVLCAMHKRSDTSNNLPRQALAVQKCFTHLRLG